MVIVLENVWQKYCECAKICVKLEYTFFVGVYNENKTSDFGMNFKFTQIYSIIVYNKFWALGKTTLSTLQHKFWDWQELRQRKASRFDTLNNSFIEWDYSWLLKLFNIILNLERWCSRNFHTKVLFANNHFPPDYISLGEGKFHLKTRRDIENEWVKILQIGFFFWLFQSLCVCVSWIASCGYRWKRKMMTQRESVGFLLYLCRYHDEHIALYVCL